MWDGEHPREEALLQKKALGVGRYGTVTAVTAPDKAGSVNEVTSGSVAPGGHIGPGVISPVPATVLKEGERERRESVGSGGNNPRERLGIKHPLVPMIPRAGLVPCWLVLELPPFQLLTVELVPRYGGDFGSDDGRVPLPVGGDEELHRIVRR